MKNRVVKRIIVFLVVMVIALFQCGCSRILSIINRNDSDTDTITDPDSEDTLQNDDFEDKQSEMEIDKIDTSQDSETDNKKEKHDEKDSEEIKQTMEEAYSEIVDELESEYGEADIKLSDHNGIYFLTGCFFDLIDFNNDGCEELLAVVYAPTADNTPYGRDYRVMIYAYNDGNAERIFDHQGLHEYPDGDIASLFATVDIVKYEGKNYLVLSDFDNYKMESLYMTYTGDDFVSMKSMAYDGYEFDDDYQCYIDGEKVDEEIFNDELDRIYKDSNLYFLWLNLKFYVMADF